jgi:hypothetical protein
MMPRYRTGLVVRATLAVCLIFLQGCLAMTYRASVISGDSGVVDPSAESLPLVVGVKAGTVDGEFNAVDERYMISHFVAKLSAANLFQQITYPTSGHEDIIFEIGGKSMLRRSYNPLMIGNILLCAFTLYLVCFPISAEYDYTVAVRAFTQPDDEEIGRYRVTGTSRITYGLLQAQGVRVINTDGWQLATTSAYDQLVARMRADEAAYRRRVKP